MTKRCGTCRWWVPPSKCAEYKPTTEDGYGHCGRVPHHDERSVSRYKADFEQYGFEENRVLAEQREQEIKANPAVVEDGSGYYAALRTRDDFACCLWEQKD